VRLAVYLPALNEAEAIGDVLDAIPRDIPGITHLDTIVVDDGSTDRTAEVAATRGARVIRHRQNLGTGRAFKSGVAAALAAGADVIVGMDADGQFSPADIASLVAPIVRGEADVVLCTRFGRRGTLTGSMPWAKRLGNRLLSWIISATVERQFSDVSCGFRAFTRSAALQVDIRSDFEYVHESLLKWLRGGQRVVEVEVPVRAVRAVGESRVLANVPYYALRAAPVLLAAIREYSPLKFAAAVWLLVAVATVLLGGGAAFGVLLGSIALLVCMLGRFKAQPAHALRDSCSSTNTPDP
jgi:glycosyltransferase involved in cell wall biosynthesis